MVTDLPKYMTGVLKFDIHRTGTLAALPYAVMWISSILFGWMCDKIVKRQWMTVTNARKTFTTIGMDINQPKILLGGRSLKIRYLLVFYRVAKRK